MAKVTARDPLLGALLGGRYRLLDVIGHGGTGRVYRAVQEPIGREVAVKVLHPDLDPDGEHDFQARFLREAALAGRIQHPHVVTVHDYGRTERGECYIVMEHLRGQTLRSAMREGALPPARCVRIAAQLTRGLRATHRAGLVHRDVKPSNVILARDDEGRDFVKLFDFGLVKGDEESAITHQGTFMGTPQYVSPEQARGDAADARSDLYSLGVILYRMLAGVLPYEGEAPISVAIKHARDPYPPMSTRAPGVAVAPELEEIVRRLMEKEPARRFRDADAVLEALRGAWERLGLEGSAGEEETVTLLRTVEDAPSLSSIEGVGAVDDALVPVEDEASVAARAPGGVAGRDDAGLDEELAAVRGRPGGLARAVLVVALVAAGAGALWWAGGRQERAAEAASQAPGAAAAEQAVAEQAAAEAAAAEAAAAEALQPREVVLLVSSDPAGAELWLDGALLGTTPLARRIAVAPGDEAPAGQPLLRGFELRLAGHRDATLELDLAGGEAAGHVALVPLRSAAGSSAAGSSAAGSSAAGSSAAGSSAAGSSAAGSTASVVADDVRFTPEEAARALAFVNEADGERLRAAGIAPRQANILLDQRPYADLAAVAATPFIGQKTLESIRAAAAR